MKKIKVSVVVPIYNSAKVLKKCLDSILCQTERDIEVICINDGSKDDSLKLLYEYNDERIVIVNQENKGAAITRLNGVDLAKGEYICFVDADDYVDLNYVKAMYDNAMSNNSDIVVCGFCREDKDSGKIYSKEMLRSGSINIKDSWEECVQINSALWNKLYKASVIKNVVRFEKYPRISEDAVILALTLLNTQKITFVDKVLYHYVINGNSQLTSTVGKEDVQNIKNAFLQVKKIYKNSGKTYEFIDIYTFLHIGVALTYKLIQTKEINYKQEIKEILTFLDNNFSSWRTTEKLNFKYVMKFNRNKKLAILRFVMKHKLYVPFFKTYDTVINKFKIDIKW